MRRISPQDPVFIIAEAGVNHNGDFATAKKLVDAARKAGADAVKFQTFKAEDLVTAKAKKARYQEESTGAEETQLQMLKKLELSYDDFKRLKEYCDETGVTFLSTPHTTGAADFLEDLVPLYKVGSGDLTNLPFLEKLARKGKPLIVSTGMGDMGEVKEALRVIKKAGNNDVVMLHCTTNYPCPLNEVNLNAMLTMMDGLDCLIGYSDHTMGYLVPIMASSLGAVVIEKHFTLDRNMKGPDHKASLTPKEFEEMVRMIRDCKVAMGGSDKKPTISEREISSVARKSLVAKVDIRKGITITRDMITVKRPGTGIPSKDLDKVMGKICIRDIKKDELIEWGRLR
ncbi:MAG: N-acetylneuraminate synthase [Candidatus Altiarchaeota archaeon]|nr:N-acetylneuraminate synthase [Candidatus Altiarchaeota archaeon]